jgi:hypothetical protein
MISPSAAIRRWGIVGAVIAAFSALAPAPGGLAAKTDAEEAAKTASGAAKKTLELQGIWEVAYRDKHLGAVQGRAVFARDRKSVEVELYHPKTGKKYVLKSTSLSRTGDKVKIVLRGRSPWGGERAELATEGERLLVPSNLTRIHARLDKASKKQEVQPGGLADLDRVVLDLEVTDVKPKDAEAKDSKAKDSKTKDAETKDTEAKDAETKDTEAKDAPRARRARCWSAPGPTAPTT